MRTFHSKMEILFQIWQECVWPGGLVKHKGIEYDFIIEFEA
jgi:hypothetical protein